MATVSLTNLKENQSRVCSTELLSPTDQLWLAEDLVSARHTSQVRVGHSGQYLGWAEYKCGKYKFGDWLNESWCILSDSCLLVKHAREHMRMHMHMHAVTLTIYTCRTTSCLHPVHGPSWPAVGLYRYQVNNLETLCAKCTLLSQPWLCTKGQNSGLIWCWHIVWWALWFIIEINLASSPRPLMKKIFVKTQLNLNQ